MTERRRGNNGGGRHHKGPRELVGTRVHTMKKDEVDDDAEAAGVNRNDWLEAAIDLALDQPALHRQALARLRAKRPQLAFDDQQVLGESA